MSFRGLQLLEGIPRSLLIVGFPVVAFVVTIGVTLATSSDGSGTDAAPTLEVAVQRSQVTPTPAPATPTAVALRTNCGEIQGTAYRSDAEREWFLKNCNGATQATSAGGTAGGTGGGGAATANTRYGVEVPTGDRLVISKIGVNASVTKMSVGTDGVMPNPGGYDNVVLYDFSAIGGLGGSPTGGGNATFAGHVDCGRCRNGGPGLAVLYYLRNVVNGDVIEYYTAGGGYQRFVVSYVGDYQPEADWAAIVSSGAADMTLITCTGTFSGGEYNLRRVVQARKA